MSLVADLNTHGRVGRKVFVVIILMIPTIGIIAALAWLSEKGRIKFPVFAGASALLLSAAGVVGNFYLDDRASPDEVAQLLENMESVSWSEGSKATKLQGASTTSVASVPSLIGGLEARLEKDPNDAKGWALLAQSYAFVGQLDLAESALQRAVELGFDESSLRSRVNLARGDAAPAAKAETTGG